MGDRLGISLQKTIEAALDAFLAHAGVPEPGAPTSDEQAWIRKLLALLRSGDEARIGVVQFVLDGHAQSERAKRKQAG